MRARLTSGEDIPRAGRVLNNPHESRRAALPVLLTVDEAAGTVSRDGASHLGSEGVHFELFELCQLVAGRVPSQHDCVMAIQ